MEKQNYNLILLCTPKTAGSTLKYINYYQKFINPKKIVIIGNKRVKEIVSDYYSINYLCEDDVFPGLTFDKVRNLYSGLIIDKSKVNRVGWYFQQFLKMAYATICEEDYYMVWDADTIPIHEIHMFEEKTGKPYFDMKTEYNKDYFDTIRKLLPGLDKCVSKSFVSEHMIISKEIMIKLVNEMLQNSSIEGEDFWQKIIYSVSKTKLTKSGFSEFETYGTYTIRNYGDKYLFRDWKSLREGTLYCLEKRMNEGLRIRISNRYDAISFEQHSMHLKMSKLFDNNYLGNLQVIFLLDIVLNNIRKTRKKYARNNS